MSENDTNSIVTCEPPVKFARNQHGLICSPNIQYVYKPNGRIDWRAMVPKEYIVPNRQKTQETDISKLTDKDLLILLFGFRELVDIRGYHKIAYTPICSQPDSVTVSCHITWIGNYETENLEKISGGVGDANPENTTGFGKSFLSPIAENRAFIRAVRNFLKINVVGFEEANPAFVPSEQVAEDFVKSIKPEVILEEAMRSKNVSFERLKSQLVSDNFPNADAFTCVSEIPQWKIIELTGRIKKISA